MNAGLIVPESEAKRNWSQSTLVYVDNDYGIGLQDHTGFFALEPLAQGAYFTADGFNSPDGSALVRLNSPPYRMLAQGSTVVNG